MDKNLVGGIIMSCVFIVFALVLSTLYCILVLFKAKAYDIDNDEEEEKYQNSEREIDEEGNPIEEEAQTPLNEEIAEEAE